MHEILSIAASDRSLSSSLPPPMRGVTQRELTNREIAQREDLYSEFIRQRTACYAKALSQSLENIDEIVAM